MMVDQQRLTPEMLVPRMGEYLIQKGLISKERLQEALDYQQEATAKFPLWRMDQGSSLVYKAYGL